MAYRSMICMHQQTKGLNFKYNPLYKCRIEGVLTKVKSKGGVCVVTRRATVRMWEALGPGPGSSQVP